MAAENAGRNPGTLLQTVSLEFLQISFVAKRHSLFETQEAVSQRTDYHFLRTIFVQQTVGDGIHCVDRDGKNTVLRQSRYAKHASTVEITPQALGQTQ